MFRFGWLPRCLKSIDEVVSFDSDGNELAWFFIAVTLRILRINERSIRSQKPQNPRKVERHSSQKSASFSISDVRRTKIRIVLVYFWNLVGRVVDFRVFGAFFRVFLSVSVNTGIIGPGATASAYVFIIIILCLIAKFGGHPISWFDLAVVTVYSIWTQLTADGLRRASKTYGVLYVQGVTYLQQIDEIKWQEKENLSLA